MSQQQEDIRVVEVSIEQAREAIEKGEALKRLLKNKDFESIVTEGYFENEAIRNVMAKTSPSCMDADSQLMIDDGIKAIGIFRQYLMHIRRTADIASTTLEESRMTLAELNEEIDPEEEGATH
jgi:hypothetical protein